MVKNKKKRTRDPARPKRAMTPFLYFACAQRRGLKERNEKLTLSEQSKLIAEQWKILEDKSSYEALSKVDKERYADEMSRYVPPKKIKRPRSSYAFFMKDHRQIIADEHPDKSPRELMGFIAQAWKAIDATKKAYYVHKAEEDKIRYTNEKESEQNNKSKE